MPAGLARLLALLILCLAVASDAGAVQEGGQGGKAARPPRPDTKAPVISSVASSNLTSSGATIGWTTNEASDSRIEYGLTTAYGNSKIVAAPLGASHRIDLVGLAAGKRHHYRVLSKDAAGNLARSRDFTFTTASATVEAAGAEPELPRVWLDTTLAPATGRTITVNAGDDLQAALDAALPGDTLALRPGAVFLAPSAGFRLPAKTNPNGQWIIVRAAEMGALPAAGERVNPSYAGVMPKIVSRDVTPAITTAPGASFWRLIGLEVTLDSNAVANATEAEAGSSYSLINLGDGGEAQVANLATDLIIDRCYVHGLPRKNVRRGVALNSRRTSIIDSYFADFHETGADSQAICGWNGPGPFKIVNNYLEGAGENVLFGGADPAVPGLVPADIEFRRNHCFKPRSWYERDPSFGGIVWSVKNLFELKNARRALIEGNLFENNWVQSQNGFAILFTVRNQDGGSPWSTIEDVTFSSNILRHASSGINILGRDYNYASEQVKRLTISNNLFEDINSSPWGGAARFLQITETVDVRVEHNTIFHTGNVCMAYGVANTGFVYRNNISAHNEYGFIGDSRGPGLPTFEAYFPAAIFVGNILAGGPSASYPESNYFPETLDAVGFVDPARGNYRLSASSPYKNAGMGGKDPGLDSDALNAAMIGASSFRFANKSAKKR